MPNSSRPLLRSRTSSLESLSGDREVLRRRSGLRSRGRSWSRITREAMGLRSLPLGSLTLSGRRGGGDRDRDLLRRVTPRSTLPRSRRSSPLPQLSFIATYRARKWHGEGMLTRRVAAELKNGSSICSLARSPGPRARAKTRLRAQVG